MIVTSLERLGAVVRERRKELGLTQSELAERAGVTRQWLSRLEQGKDGASVQRLLLLCDELELVVDLRKAAPVSTPQQAAPSLMPQSTLDEFARLARADVAGIIPRSTFNAIASRALPDFSQLLTPELRDQLQKISRMGASLPFVGSVQDPAEEGQPDTSAADSPDKQRRSDEDSMEDV